MLQIRALASAAACLAAASIATSSVAGEPCTKACCDAASSAAPTGPQLVTSDFTTSALMLSASTNLRVDVGPLLAQRPLRVGVDDVRRPGFNGMNWNGSLPGAYASARGDCYAASYGAAGAENAVILVHAGPRQIIAIHPFAPIPTSTADGQPMSPDLVRNLESQRSRWLNDNGFTGGVRTFTNDKPERTTKADARLIKPRGIIELNPEAPRTKRRMDVRAEPAPVFLGVATTGQNSDAAPLAATSATIEATSKPTPPSTPPASTTEKSAKPPQATPIIQVATAARKP